MKGVVASNRYEALTVEDYEPDLDSMSAEDFHPLSKTNKKSSQLKTSFHKQAIPKHHT